jgi:hypothetical protein
MRTRGAPIAAETATRELGVQDDRTKSAKSSRSGNRTERLAAELRANLKRRKAQARGRAAEVSEATKSEMNPGCTGRDDT